MHTITAECADSSGVSGCTSSTVLTVNPAVLAATPNNWGRQYGAPNGPTHLDVSHWLDTGVQVVVGGTPGQVYQIQASDDLLHWTVLETVSAGPTGAIELPGRGGAHPPVSVLSRGAAIASARPRAAQSP